MKSKILSEEEIDEIVITQANDDSQWEEPIHVHRSKKLSIPVTSKLAERIAFFTRLHHEPSVGDWLRHIIQERLDMEESAFVELKHDLERK
jgi:DNA polymerase III alpha subunit (gram-positive type)